MKSKNENILFNQLSKYFIVSVGLSLLIIIFFESFLHKEKYLYTSEKCVNGYYEEYWTNGRMINYPNPTASRKLKRWVCTKYVTDTLVGYKYVWNK